MIRSGPDRGPVPELPAGVLRRFTRNALLPLEIAALASVLCAVRVGAEIGEADMRSAIPPDATPLEIEKLLRSEAQLQARTLHQCFDVLPIGCQKRGYVGVSCPCLARARSASTRSRGPRTARTVPSISAWRMWSEPGSSSRCHSR